METWFVFLVSGGHAPPPLIDIDNTVFVQFGIFIVLLFILTKLVFRPYLALLRERSENIDGARDEAQRDTVRADEDLDRYQEQVKKARQDAAQVRAELRTEGEQQAGQILYKARLSSEEKVNAARVKIEKSAQAAKLALRTRADQIAKSVAAKLLGREV